MLDSSGISLLCVAGKLYTRVRINRIRATTDGAIGEEQCGIRSGNGWTVQTLEVLQEREKYIVMGEDVSWTFMDL